MKQTWFLQFSISLHKITLEDTLSSDKQTQFSFHKPKQMSTSDSDYIDDNNTTDTDSNDNSDNDSSDNEDVLEEVLLVDIACQRYLCFFFFHSVIETLKQGFTLWIMPFLTLATMLPFSMMENCHSILHCEIKATQSIF